MKTILRKIDLEIELQLSPDPGNPDRRLSGPVRTQLTETLAPYLRAPENRSLVRSLLEVLQLAEGDITHLPTDTYELREALIARIETGRILFSPPQPCTAAMVSTGISSSALAGDTATVADPSRLGATEGEGADTNTGATTGAPAGAATADQAEAGAGAGATEGEGKKSDTCRVDGFTLSGADPEREYKLEVPGKIPAGEKPRFQVVGGAKKGGEIKVTTKIGAGPCERHANRLISVPGLEPALPDAGGSFHLPCHKDYALEQNIRKIIWPYKAKPKESRVKLSACQTTKPAEVTIEVFPDLHWEAGISAGYSTQAERKAGQRRKTKVDSSFTVEGEISVESDQHKKSLKASYEQEINTALQLLNDTKGMVEYVADCIDYIGGVELEFTWPTFVLKGSWGYEEQDDGPLVEYKYDVTVGFSPLIGIMGRVDILDILCHIVPALGTFIAKVKRRIAKGIGNEVIGAKGVMAIWLSAEATIEGTLSVTGVDMKREPVEGKIGGELELMIKPEVSVELHIVIINFCAGIEGYAKTVLSGELTGAFEEKGLYIDGEFAWSGIVLGWRAYYHVGAEIQHEGLRKKGKGKTERTGALEGGEEYGNEVKIVEGKKFPFRKQPVLQKG